MIRIKLNVLDISKRYAPILKLDEHEPFLPYGAGITLFEQEGSSHSFRRNIEFTSQTKFVLEYAIYWDYDIQHLYDLEHIWIYVDHQGAVYDCEASFHGKYFRGLFSDHRNLHGQQVQLFCQPGKHAFSPIVELFDLLPKVEQVTNEAAGRDGLLVPWIFEGEFSTDAELDRKIKIYLKSFAFQPKRQYQSYTFSEEQLMSWEQLRTIIPQRIQKQIEIIENWINNDFNSAN